MILFDEVETALCLWLPEKHEGIITDPEEIEDQLKKIHLANGAAVDFMHNQVSEEDFLDIVESTEVDMDDYLKATEEDIHFLLG